MFKPLVLGLIFVLLGCKSTGKQPYFESSELKIEITNILEDTLSIRALDYADGKYWFAGSNGKFGYIDMLTDLVTLKQIDVENNLEFRSLAVTPNYTYVLTAGNPALIYKISHDDEKLEVVYTEKGEDVFYDSMKFWNDDEGIAMGDPQDGCFSILKTINAGKSWQKINCNNLPKALSNEAAFAASNSNLSINGDNVWLVTGGSHSRVLHSADRGQTWGVYDTPITSGEQMTGIYAVDFFNENLGVIIGGDWNIKESNSQNKAFSKDGGKTWKLVSEKSGPGYSSDIIFIPETDGQEFLAVGSQGIWWSGNQGQSWIELSEEGFYTVKMISSTQGYLAGRNRISKFSLMR